MKIHGLQKMTLLDFPGKVACTVFLGGCDMRCPFCHNWELVDGSAKSIMDEKELLSFLEKRIGLLDGVAFTGGEPLLRDELPDLIADIRRLGFKIKLDTNGNHPDKLIQLVSGGFVDYVAMDIKNSKERYTETIGLYKFDISSIEESVSFLLSDSAHAVNKEFDYEFRTTTMKQFHDADSFEGIAEWICGASNYYIQSFTDRDTVHFSGFEAYSKEELEVFADIVRPHVRHIELRGV